MIILAIMIIVNVLVMIIVIKVMIVYLSCDCKLRSTHSSFFKTNFLIRVNEVAGLKISKSLLNLFQIDAP